MSDLFLLSERQFHPHRVRIFRCRTVYRVWMTFGL